MADIPLVIRDLLGVNRRDGGERASDREFYAIQNLYRKEKGELTKRHGTSHDLHPNNVPGCERITAISRHPSNPCPNAVLYHCTPDSTQLVSPTADLVLIEETASDGEIFDCANPASLELRFAYTFVGKGVESSWDTRSKAGFVDVVGTDAWDQDGLQTITLSSATNKVRVIYPTAFPDGVRAVNVFMSYGNASDTSTNRTNLVYVGTMYSNGDHLIVNSSTGPGATFDDPFVEDDIEASAEFVEGAAIPPGQYYIALAWIADRGANYQDTIQSGEAYMYLSEGTPVQVTPDKNAIKVNFHTVNGTSDTVNGATHAYVFLGTRPPKDGPMACIGTLRAGTTGSTPYPEFQITDIPVNCNAQSIPFGTTAVFDNSCRMFAGENKARHGFIVKKDPDRSVLVSEVFISRTYFYLNASPGYDNILLIRTPLDRVFSGLLASDFDNVGANTNDPSIAYHNGFSFFANGYNFLMTDGFSLCRVPTKDGCAVPEYLRYVIGFKNQLIGISRLNENLAYGSNALEYNNWSEGGSGTDLKFLIIGDGFEGKVTAAGVFASTTGVNDLRSMLVFFKKSSTHMYTNIPDKASGINAQAEQSSGRVGCIAPKSIIQTRSGLVFLGSDGDIYIIRGAGEPVPIGGRIKPLFAHLVENESLMKLVSASFHKNFVKISYPSSADSTYNDAQIWGDFRTEEGVPIAWDGPHTGINVGVQEVLIGTGDTETRIGARSDAAGSVVLDDEDSSLDLTAPIVSFVEWNRRKLKAELNWKRFMAIAADISWNSGEDHTLLFELWSGREYTQKSVTVSTASADFAEQVYDTIVSFIGDDNLVGRDLKFRITHTGGQNFTLSAVGITYKPERRMIT